MRESGDNRGGAPEFTPNRVLLTGASGFIGRHLIDLLRSQGISVRTLGRHPPTDVPKVLQDHVVADIRHDFTRASDGCDCIIHLAGLSDASASYENPVEFTETNVIGTLRAL